MIRYLTIRVDEHEAGPSAMLRKREDSDRDDADRAGRAATGPTVGIAATVRPAAPAMTLNLGAS